MSNINDENTPVNEPEPQPGIGHVDPALASRLGSLPRTASGNPINPPWGKILTALDQIRYLNDRVRINTESTAKFLSDHMKDLERTQGIARDVSQQQDRLDQKDRTSPRGLASASDLHIVEMRKEFDRQKAELLKMQPDAIDVKGNLPKDVEDKLVRSSIDKFKNDPELLARARQLENIAEGRTSAGTLIDKFRGMIPHLGSAHGLPHRPEPTVIPADQYSIFDEVGQQSEEDRNTIIVPSRRTRFAGALGRGAESENRAVRGASRVGARLLGGEALGAAAIPGLGEALIGFELLKNFGRDIPIVGSGVVAAREMFGRETRLTGQLTGEERGAGIAARFDAASLTPGGRLSAVPFVGGVASTIGGLLHPFDPITNQIATEIVNSVRTQGFTGARARDLYQGVADVYRDLGLSIDQTTKMITDATRNGGESLQQIVTEMKSFDTAAHNLGININEYAASVESTAERLRAGGAGPQATTLAQQFVAGAPRILQTGAGLEAYTQLFQRATPFIAARMGIPAWELNDPRYASQAQQGLQQAEQEEILRSPGTTLRQKAEWASANGLIFKGMGVDQIMAIMRQNAANRGPVGVAQLESARTRLRGQVTNLRGRENVAVRDMTQEQLDAAGITSTRTIRRGGPPVQTYTWNGRRISPDYELSRSVSMEAIPMRQLAEARTTALASVRNILTRKQVTELEKHIDDRSYKFADRLQQFETQGGRRRNSIITPYGEIKISLTGKAKKAFKAEVTQSQRSYQYGNTQANQSFPYPDTRVDPLGIGD